MVVVSVCMAVGGTRTVVLRAEGSVTVVVRVNLSVTDTAVGIHLVMRIVVLKCVLVNKDSVTVMVRSFVTVLKAVSKS